MAVAARSTDLLSTAERRDSAHSLHRPKRSVVGNCAILSSSLSHFGFRVVLWFHKELSKHLLSNNRWGGFQTNTKRAEDFRVRVSAKTQTLKKRQSFSWMVRTNVSHEERRLAAFHHFQELKSSRLLVSNIFDLKIPMWVDDPIGGPASFQLGGVENINCQQKTTKSFGRRQIRSLRGDLS